jgi:hypothetical protein
MVADIAIVNGSYLTALVLRMVLESEIRAMGDARADMATAVELYMAHAPLLTVIAMVVYFVSGFYSRGRFYTGRFKALAIVQAVSLTYLIFGFVQYIGLANGWLVATPRIAMAISWGLTLGASLAARPA